MFTLKSQDVPDGTVLLMDIEYENQGDELLRKPVVYTYALLKAGGLWYTTGTGRGPVAAGWGAVERWLGKDGRRVREVRVVTEAQILWPVEPGPPLATHSLPEDEARCRCGRALPEPCPVHDPELFS